MRHLLFACALVAATASAADANPRGRRYHANKKFGAGIELGEPTGLNGKYFLESDRAIDFGFGEHYGDGYGDGLHIYGDYLWHPLSLASTESFELPLYFGVGARLWEFDYHAADGDGYALGVRVPLGISFDFKNVPIDVFVQLTFVVDFLVDYGPHTLYGGLDGSIGVRYWFE